MNIATKPVSIDSILMADLVAQRSHAKAAGIENYQQRREHLLALKAMITENQARIIEAINQDYGNRSRHETLLAEIINACADINSTLKHLKKWMKVQKRHVDHRMYLGAKNRVIPQPLGVVGLIVP
ncbi:hypothetical protein [Pseudoalteromonas sp.]